MLPELPQDVLYYIVESSRKLLSLVDLGNLRLVCRLLNNDVLRMTMQRTKQEIKLFVYNADRTLDYSLIDASFLLPFIYKIRRTDDFLRMFIEQEKALRLQQNFFDIVRHYLVDFEFFLKSYEFSPLVQEAALALRNFLKNNHVYRRVKGSLSYNDIYNSSDFTYTVRAIRICLQCYLRDYIEGFPVEFMTAFLMPLFRSDFNAFKILLYPRPVEARFLTNLLNFLPRQAYLCQ
jgi:hypothetical protein